MYALALGVSHISTVLPLPVYALLSGLNASVVGVIAFAAVQLATKAITDPLSRLLVIFSACAGLCYNALWYFPVLMVAGGTSTVVWDLWARGAVARFKRRWRRRKDGHATLGTSGGDLDLAAEGTARENGVEDGQPQGSIMSAKSADPAVQLRRIGGSVRQGELPGENEAGPPDEVSGERSMPEPVSRVARGIPPKVGLAVLAAFFGKFLNPFRFKTPVLTDCSVFHRDHGCRRCYYISASCAESLPQHVSGR